MSPLALVLIGFLGWLVLRLVLLALVGRWAPPATVAAASMLRRRYTSRSWASTLVELASHLMLATSILIAVGVGGIQLLDSQEHTVAVFGTLQWLTAMANAHLPVVIFVCAGMAAATVALYIALTRDHVLAKFAALKSDLRPTEEMRPLLDEARDLRRAKESMRTKLNKGLHRTLTLLRINHQLARVTRKLNQKDLERRSEQLRLDPMSVTGPAGLRWLTGPRRILGFCACLFLAASCTSLAFIASPSALLLLIEKKELSIVESELRDDWAMLERSLDPSATTNGETRVTERSALLVSAFFEHGVLSLLPNMSWSAPHVVRRQVLDSSHSSPTTLRTPIARLLEQHDPVARAVLQKHQNTVAPENTFATTRFSNQVVISIGTSGQKRSPVGDPVLRAALDVVAGLYLVALANGVSPSGAFQAAIERAPRTFFRDWDLSFLHTDFYVPTTESMLGDDPYYAVFPGPCATDFNSDGCPTHPPYYTYVRPEPQVGPVPPEDRRQDFRGSTGPDDKPPRTPGGPRPSPLGRDSAYGRLDRYVGLGGVLVGKPPKSMTATTVGEAIVDVLWRDSGDLRLNLTVRLEDGTSRAGTFNKRLVGQALRYAVENRPAAVTILPTSVAGRYDPYVRRVTNFLSEELNRELDLIDNDMWVYLHPMLRNTPLGCSFVEVDQLVDSRLADDHALREELDRLVASKIEDDPALREKLDRLVREEHVRLVDGRLADDPALREELDGFVASRLADDPARREEVVRRVDGRLADPALREELLNDYVEEVLRAIPTDKRRQLRRQQLVVVPQVRERTYELTDVMDVLDDSFSGRGVEFPLYFTIYYEEETDVRGKKRSALAEIPGVEELLDDVVDHMDPSLRYEVAQFVYLQRLFRGVLLGYFGDRFPVSKLFYLAKSTGEEEEGTFITRRRYGWIEANLEGGTDTKGLLEEFKSRFGSDTHDSCVGRRMES